MMTKIDELRNHIESVLFRSVTAGLAMSLSSRLLSYYSQGSGVNPQLYKNEKRNVKLDARRHHEK